MALLAIPNVSEGRDPARIRSLAATIEDSDALLLDVHSDSMHHRSVFTVTGDTSTLVTSMVALAEASRYIDLTRHEGVHPRLGALDVCPIVPFEADMQNAIDVARSLADGIGAVGIPVFLYGRAARRQETASLPTLRRGGLAALVTRVRAGLHPDAGPVAIDPHIGVVCVGARGPLIAFNAVVGCDLPTARAIAGSLRRTGSLQALALPAAGGSQLSMNLVAPEQLGIEDAFALVSDATRERDLEIISTELVGLVEERFLPDRDAQTARLLIEPGRSVESALRD